MASENELAEKSAMSENERNYNEPTKVRLLNGNFLDWSVVLEFDDNTVKQLLTETDLIITSLQQEIETARNREQLDERWLERIEFVLKKVYRQRTWLKRETTARKRVAKQVARELDEQRKAARLEQEAAKAARTSERSFYLEAFRSVAYLQLSHEAFEALDLAAKERVEKMHRDNTKEKERRSKEKKKRDDESQNS